MAGPTALVLRCGRCGASLCGQQQDVVFWCSGCHVPHEVVGEAFVERRGYVARAVIGGQAAALHLPLWAFRVQYVCQWQEKAREALARQIPAVEWVYVTGFGVHNASYFGDPGMIFTEKRVRLEEAGPALVAGCSRSLAEAKAYVEPHLLAVIDRRVDVTGLEMSCAIGDARLWGVPYIDEGDALRDGILGLRIPAAALDDVAAIRRGLGARR
jgi:hypothetical protein